ncbi:serine/threonine-protein kinase [Streptomyces sp. NPDC006207]
MTVGDALEAGDPRRVGRYEIVARLGAGGMGRVYLGRSPGGRAMAIKVVRPDLADDEEFLRRFGREVAAARRVNGVYTAAVVDADPDGRPPWLATAYVPGLSLDKAVSSYGPWAPDAVLALGAGLVEALEAIHAAGVVHRDLKPANVLLSADGPRVIDFGISIAGDTDGLTRTGVAVGTPGFMAPEQVMAERAGPACDVFALGAVLLWTATGAPPFGAGSAYGVNYRAVHAEPDLTRLPAGLREVVRGCLAKDPQRRLGTTAVLEMIKAALGHRPAQLSVPEHWLPAPVARAVRSSTTAAQPEPTLEEPAPPPGPEPRPDPLPHLGPNVSPRPDPDPPARPETRSEDRPEARTGTDRSRWLRRSALGLSALVSVAALTISALVYGITQREDPGGTGGTADQGGSATATPSRSPSPELARVVVVTFKDGPIRSSPPGTRSGWEPCGPAGTTSTAGPRVRRSPRTASTTRGGCGPTWAGADGRAGCPPITSTATTGPRPRTAPTSPTAARWCRATAPPRSEGLPGGLSGPAHRHPLARGTPS